MNLRFKFSCIILALSFATACKPSDEVNLYTGNEVDFELLPGDFDGNTTSGNLMIKERTDGNAEIEITLNGIIQGASHPAHLHFGSLEANGLMASLLNPVEETNGIGKSSTLLTALDNGTIINYASLLVFDGSVKIHFEQTGALKHVILGATNIGINSSAN